MMRHRLAINSVGGLIPLAVLLLMVLLPLACGPNDDSSRTPPSEDKDFIDRFNVVVRDIRDFPKSGKGVEKYFNIWSTTAQYSDAPVIMFGELHSNAANQIWSAGAMNKIIKEGDVVLFEGCPSGAAIGDITSAIVRRIFVAREFENIKVNYKPDSGIKIWEKYYKKHYAKNRQHLDTALLNFHKAQGYCWDAPDINKDHVIRNAAMVKTIKTFLTQTNRVFVIAGALHIPHYAFAAALSREKIRTAFLGYPGALVDEINDAFFSYFAAQPGDEKEFASTKVIFDYLKGQDFAVMIPKNIVDCSDEGVLCPKNAR